MEREYAERFERVIRSIFESQGYSVLVEEPQNRDKGYDLRLLAPNHETIVVEIKLYRSRNVSQATLLQVVTFLAESRDRVRANGALLITTADADPSVVERSRLLNVEILGYRTIALWPTEFPEHADEINSILREGVVYRERDLASGVGIDAISRWIRRIPPPYPNRRRGTQLCNELRAIPVGKPHSAQFEAKCLECLKYVFQQDLAGWWAQQNTHSRLHRYDVIARIASDIDFWQGLISDFSSRYVVFEFKNLSRRVTQKEIYTTEKYLYRSAMRSIAIIVSRLGNDDGAALAAQGALREQGKLILMITVDDLCRMLHSKESGGEPSDVLVDHVDDLLTRLDK